MKTISKFVNQNPSKAHKFSYTIGREEFDYLDETFHQFHEKLSGTKSPDSRAIELRDGGKNVRVWFKSNKAMMEHKVDALNTLLATEFGRSTGIY